MGVLPKVTGNEQIIAITGGSNGGTYAKYFTGRIRLVEDSYDVNANTSLVYYYLELVSGSSGRFSDYWADWSITIDGSVVASGGQYVDSMSYNTVTTIKSGSITITHGSDGKKNVSFSAVIDFNSGTYSPGDFNLVDSSKVLTLYNIPRTSVPTITGTFELGGTITIKTNRASSSFTHEMYYYWNNDISHKWFAGEIGDSKTWTIPKDLANYIPGNDSGTLRILVGTYNGTYSNGTFVGNNEQSFNVKVPNTAEFKPTISSVTISEAVSDIATKFGAYIQNQSKITGSITAAGAYSSTISSYKTTINGTTYNSATFTTDVLKLDGANTFSVEVIDTRKRPATYSGSFTVKKYIGPTIKSISANRCLQNGTLDDEGEYAKIDVTAELYHLDRKNTFSYNLQYRDTDEEDYEPYDFTMTTTISGDVSTSTGTCIIPANGDNSFEYLFNIQDTFLSASKARTIETVFQLINYGASGKGLAFGKVCERDAFECDLDIYYKDIELVNLIYPVGSIYMSVNNSNPSTWLGGTWVAWGSGRVPVGVNASDSNFSTVEKTGGASTHTHTQGATGAATGNTGSTALTVNQIPSHSHTFTAVQRVSTAESVASGAYGYISQTLSTGNTGGGAGHTHTLNSHTHTNPTTNSSSSLQPYITCYMWKRTA